MTHARRRSITVQWEAVDCIHRNEDIIGFSVRYGVQGSGEGDRTVQMSSGDSSRGMYQISGLSAATVYTIEVAAALEYTVLQLLLLRFLLVRLSMVACMMVLTEIVWLLYLVHA